MAATNAPRSRILLFLLGAIVVLFILGKITGPSSPTSGTTSTYAPPPAESPRVVAAGGLACRSRATYERLGRKVAGILAQDYGGDSLAAFAGRHRGCRRLSEDGEYIDSFELIAPQRVKLWLSGDSLPLYAHRLAIDTLK